MTRWNQRILFIDAFAGPGEYSRGELGSPLIALEALLGHSGRVQMTSEIIFLFIEKDVRRSSHLEELLRQRFPRIPSNIKYRVIKSTFDETLTEVLDDIEKQNTYLAPAFVMIDPFGVSETPMRTITRILSNPKSEVYISFMYEALNRFKGRPEFEGHLDELFGTNRWREGVVIADREERKAFFYELYRRQLKRAGAEYVLKFELFEGGRLVYAIFFGTQDLMGCDKMKQAIWENAPMGDYRFQSGSAGQIALADLADFGAFQNELRNEFAERGWVGIEDVLDFARSDRTGFHSRHVKKQTLRPMELNGDIEVLAGSRMKARTYPDGTKLRFRV